MTLCPIGLTFDPPLSRFVLSPPQIASAVGDVKDAVFESVSVAVEAVGSGVEGVTDAVTETVSHLGEQVMETVSHGVEEVTDSISETMTSLGAQANPLFILSF